MFFMKKYRDKYWFLDAGDAWRFIGLLYCKGFTKIKLSYETLVKWTEGKENKVPAYMVVVKDVEPKMIHLRKYIDNSYEYFGITDFTRQIVK